MQRTKRSTAVAVLPSPPAGGTPGYFAQPNPQGGVPATVPGYEWYNNVQEELVGLVLAAGLSLSDNDATQLVQAIIKKGLQGSYFNIGTAGGTADAITATYTPAIAALSNGMTLYVRAASANATTTPTFTPASGTIAAKTIVKGAGAALVAGDIAGGGHWIELQYDATLDKWVLLNPASGFTRGTQTFLSSGSFTVPAGVTTVYLTGCGGGGGGAAYSSAGNGGGGGGSAASCVKRAVTVTPGAVITVTIGSGGSGGATAGTAGGSGGTTSFGALLTMSGGGGGVSAGAGGSAGTISGGAGLGTNGTVGEQYNRNAGVGSGGFGGSSMFGAGGIAGGTTATAGASGGFGSGGAGGGSGQGSGGSGGFLIVEW